MQYQIVKQSTIIFEALQIQSNFQKQFGIQIAFYRNDKIKKIDPIKLSIPQKKIPLDSMMQLHTTLNYNQEQDRIQSKIFKMQVVFKIDGTKNSLQKDIDPSYYYKRNKQTFTLRITDKPQTELKYRVLIVFKDQVERARPQGINLNTQRQQNRSTSKLDFKSKEQLQMKSKPKSILTNNRSLKLIKFEDNTQQNDDQIDLKQRQMKKYNTVKIMQNRQQSSRFQSKTEIQINSQSATDIKYQSSTNNKYQSCKFQFLEKQVRDKSRQLSKTASKYSELQVKYKQLGSKYQKLGQKYKYLSLVSDKCKKQVPSQEASQDRLKQKQKYQKLQKQYRKLEEQSERRLEGREAQIKRLSGEVKLVSEEVRKKDNALKTLRQENKQMQQLLLEVQGKNQTAGNSTQQSLKPYKQRIRMLQRQNQELQEEKNFSEEQTRGKVAEISQLKHKIRNLNEQNLVSLQQMADKDYEVQKLSKKVKDLQRQAKDLQRQLEDSEKRCIDIVSDNEDDQDEGTNFEMFKSQKVLGSGGESSGSKLKVENNQLKTKLAIALKNLENKESLLKKFDAFSKQGRKQLQDQVLQVRKENIGLKQKLQQCGSAKGNAKNDQLGHLQSRMEVQKVKKELEYKTKSQRQLLIEKSQMESKNKTLQEDVIKSKESVANILNVIQQFGDQGLIEEVSMFLG